MRWASRHGKNAEVDEVAEDVEKQDDAGAEREAERKIAARVSISPAVKVTLFHASALKRRADLHDGDDGEADRRRRLGRRRRPVRREACASLRRRQKLCQLAPKFAAMAAAFCATKPTRTTAARARTLAEVKTFCTEAPSLTPKVLSRVSRVMMTIAARFAVFRPMSILPRTMGPRGIAGTCAMCQSQWLALTEGKKTPRNLPKATPTAAMVPVWMTRKRVQP